MSILKVEHLDQSYLDKTLYDDADLTVNEHDHMGIIGQNGVGKSTLIHILTGSVEPDGGKITWKHNIKIGYLDQYANLKPGQTIRGFLRTAFQDLYDCEKKLEQLYVDMSTNSDPELMEKAGKIQEYLEANNFYDVDTEIERVASGLGIAQLGYDHDVSKLSGGQRSKIILAKLLLSHPDILLLDEPTNYLDTAHIDWLAGYLNDFPGAFVVISHDYDFLGRITNVVCDIEFGKITRYTGTLKQALRQKAANRRTYMKTYAAQQKKISKTEAYIRKNKAGSRSKSAKSREKQLARMDVMKPPANRVKANFVFPYVQNATQMVLDVNNLVIGYDKKPVVNAKFNFSVLMGEKVVIAGYNGIGKSTLIKTLLHIIPAISGTIQLSQVAKLAYYEQTLYWEHPMAEPLRILHDEFPGKSQKELRQVLARTGLTAQQAATPIKMLSGGEQVKVKLARLMLQPANVLILDEPTNHLDEDSKESLKQSLKDYEGTVLLVTHEDSFYDSSWIDKTINIEKMSK